MDGDTVEPDLGERAVGGPCGRLLHEVEHLEAMDDLGEDGVVAVEVGLLGVGDEELAAVGVGPAVGHGHDPPGGVLERLAELVGELAAPDGGAALAGARGVAALDHEPLDVAVEHRAVVVAARAQRQEVLRRPGHLVAEHLALDVPQVGVQRHRHGVAAERKGRRRRRPARQVGCEMSRPVGNCLLCTAVVSRVGLG